ncbi:MAG: sortase [Microgenomates group bacterium]
MIKNISSFLISVSVLVLVFIFWPIVNEEAKYEIGKVLPSKSELLPVNKEFSIVVPKINASAPIIKNVDPFNKNEFLSSLKKGVAHAKNTKFPNQDGNVYLFAHSTDAFYNVSQYNAVFYLIGKLEKDDEIKIYYDNVEYSYSVVDKKVVSSDDTQYLTTNTNEKLLTLQTCYPPGTTLKRLIVTAKQK